MKNCFLITAFKYFLFIFDFLLFTKYFIFSIFVYLSANRRAEKRVIMCSYWFLRIRQLGVKNFAKEAKFFITKLF